MLKDNKKEIPSYPGELVRKAPIPPKYLLQVIETENGYKKQLIQVKGTPPQIRPQELKEPDMPIISKYSTKVPQRNYSTPAHNYPPRQEYIPPDIKKNKIRNSLVDVKSTPNNNHNNNHNNGLTINSTSLSVAGAGSLISSTSISNNLNNSNNNNNLHNKDETQRFFPALPKNPTIPRPYVPPSSSSYVGGPLLHAREASGKILGTGTARYVPDNHIPYLPSTTTLLNSTNTMTQNFNTSQTITYDISTVGPDNPIQQMNETWSACWDDEAGAVYYYNSKTGEATWISPF